MGEFPVRVVNRAGERLYVGPYRLLPGEAVILDRDSYERESRVIDSYLKSGLLMVDSPRGETVPSLSERGELVGRKRGRKPKPTREDQ